MDERPNELKSEDISIRAFSNLHPPAPEIYLLLVGSVRLFFSFQISTRFFATFDVECAFLFHFFECDTTIVGYDMGAEPYNANTHNIYFHFFLSLPFILLPRFLHSAGRLRAYLSRIQFTSFAYD